MRLVLLGPPGAGKGTQAAILSEKLGVPHISTGDLFRANIGEGTPLGVEAKSYIDAGKLVPTDVTARMVEDRLNQDDAKDGFLLDGFPRNVAQADELDDMLNSLDAGISVVLDLDVDHDEVVRRLSGRRTCKKCGHVWHLEYDRPAVADVCDRCGGELYQRDDDKPEVWQARLKQFEEASLPLLEHYDKLGVLWTVNGNSSDEISPKLFEEFERRFAV